MKVVVLYVVCANVREADIIGRTLVRERRAACVNIWPISSYYIWQRRLVKDREAVLLVKTSPALAAAATQRIKKLHSYDAPAILTYTTTSQDRQYSTWFHGILSEKKGT